MSKTILHLLQSNTFSGAENVACQIIDAFSDSSDYNMVYCCPHGPIEKQLKERGIRSFFLKNFTKKEIKRAIGFVHADIIHAHDRTASLLAARATSKIPIVAHMHVNNNKGIIMFFKNAIWTMYSKRFKHIFWVSTSAYDGFQFRSFLKKKSSILYNVLSISDIYKKRDNDKNNYFYDIIYCGRLTYQKNPERLMNICAKLVLKKEKVQIAIIGSGDYANYVEGFISQNTLEDNVHYLGYINNPLKIISESKALIMCSRFEGTPMVIIESQILGVPVVSTPVDGIKTIINNGYNGFLSDDDDELVNCLCGIIDDKVSLKDNCLAFAKTYCDIDNYRKEIEMVYLDILNLQD